MQIYNVKDWKGSAELLGTSFQVNKSVEFSICSSPWNGENLSQWSIEANFQNKVHPRFDSTHTISPLKYGHSKNKNLVELFLNTCPTLNRGFLIGAKLAFQARGGAANILYLVKRDNLPGGLQTSPGGKLLGYGGVGLQCNTKSEELRFVLNFYQKEV